MRIVKMLELLICNKEHCVLQSDVIIDLETQKIASFIHGIIKAPYSHFFFFLLVAEVSSMSDVSREEAICGRA